MTRVGLFVLLVCDFLRASVREYGGVIYRGVLRCLRVLSFESGAVAILVSSLWIGRFFSFNCYFFRSSRRRCAGTCFVLGVGLFRFTRGGVPLMCVCEFFESSGLFSGAVQK